MFGKNSHNRRELPWLNASLSWAIRRPALNSDSMFEAAKVNGVSEAELAEQRVSFAYGNAPENSGITKASAREASLSMRLLHA